MELLKTPAATKGYKQSLYKMSSYGGNRSQRLLNSVKNSKQDGGRGDGSFSAGRGHVTGSHATTVRKT